MSSSSKMYDSLHIEDYVQNNKTKVIATLVQKSIKYEKFKKFAVFDEMKYIGNYECCSVSNLKYTEINDGLCRMLFCDVKERSRQHIQKIHRWGRFSEKSEFSFIILFYVGYNQGYEITLKDQ